MSKYIIFFLNIGRYFDYKMRSKARNTAQSLLLMMSGSATIIENNKHKIIPISDIKINDKQILVLVDDECCTTGKRR